ncbi:type II secretion system secretin GspD, partial [Litorivivens sp.]
GDNNSRAYLKRLIRELDSEVKTSSNVRVHYLRYAKAEEMVPVLKSVSEAMLKQEGEREAVSKSNINIEAHEQTNSVVLSGSPHIIRNLADVISSLDIRRAQVLVEAIIVELSDSRAKELGVQWLFRGDQSGTAPIGGVNLPLQGAPGIFGVATGASAGGEALTSALSGLTGMSIGVGKIRENSFSFGALLRAISTDTETNILSTPSLLTLDNQEASILVGSEIPVITGATASSNNNNPFQTITRQEIGVKLTVTPQINEGDAVMMRLEQEVSSISNDPTPTADVVTNKRTINTSVLVNDGQTIVLGGLIDDTIQEISSKVPILGSMPIIGRLFRADKTQKSKSNLMVFIRPTIVRDSETLKGLSSEKYNYIRAQQLILHNDGINLFPAAKAPVLPVWTGLDPSPAGMLPELEAEVDPNDMPED